MELILVTKEQDDDRELARIEVGAIPIPGTIIYIRLEGKLTRWFVSYNYWYIDDPVFRAYSYLVEETE